MFDFYGLPRELRDKCYEKMLIPQIGLPSAAERERQEVERRFTTGFDEDSDQDDGESRAEGYEQEQRGNTDASSTGARIAQPKRENGSGTNKAAYAAVQVTHAPDLRFMLVSRLFKDEYLSAATRQMAMSILDVDKSSSVDPKIPKVMQAVRTIELSLQIHCGCWKIQGYNGYGHYVRPRLNKAQDLLFNLLCQSSTKPAISIHTHIVSSSLVSGRCEHCKSSMLANQRHLTRTLGLKSLIVYSSIDYCDNPPGILKLDCETKQLEEVGPSNPEDAIDVDVAEDSDEEGREGEEDG